MIYFVIEMLMALTRNTGCYRHNGISISSFIYLFIYTRYYSTFVTTRTESMFPASPKDFTRRILNSNKLAFVRELSHSK